MIRGSKPVLGTVAASRRLGQFESSAAHGNFAVIIAPGRATRQTTTPNQAQHHAISDSSCLGGFLEIPSRYSKRPETSVEAKQATQAKRCHDVDVARDLWAESSRISESYKCYIRGDGSIYWPLMAAMRNRNQSATTYKTTRLNN